MLEITGNDIKELNDSDLRSLVGLLCEAELRANGLPTAGVIWGGHQNASDGGFDVRVGITCGLHPDSFIPCANTGFQVKKSDMPRSEITSEMRPYGNLRQAIKDLADVGGAYIIVSGHGSTSHSALTRRKNAMKDALSDHPNAAKIKIDFYDRERVAGWVRSHQSLILWVRGKIEKPIPGWQPYRNWANSKGGIEEEYLIDEEVRLYNGTEQLSILSGINELRAKLCHPASSVRLVGLSGVGKTRLLQALFDGRIGEKALNPSQVYYADIGDSPDPNPQNFAEQIIALRKLAILAIDNCPTDLHSRLTSVCSASGSLVSLITIEYDIRDDQPEETEVFRLEPASIGLVGKMIQTRYPHISKVNTQTIAEFSGGNAKIAIALVNTVERDENLANLKNEDLFKRLFHQRNNFNDSLLKSAEVCALVYSFDCRAEKDSDSELKLLGSLINKSVSELFADVSELKRRGLVQQRSIWRAVLPPAIANRLAQRAIENIPLDDILKVFEKSGSERMLKSFSRRLGYLHESEIAKTIADKWFSKDGLLNDISNLNGLGINILKNIAPVKPESTLTAIEQAANIDEKNFVSRTNTNYVEFTRLLRSLAYDKVLFERAVDLLCRFALTEKPDENNNSIRDLLKSLFYIWLSGTHASAEQRLEIIQKLINSSNEEKQNLGLLLLNSALEAEHFNSYHDFEFGARSRDYGFWPKTKEEVYQWFNLFINFSLELALSEQLISIKGKAILAEKFKELWMRGMFDELEDAAKKIANKGPWNEGWIAVRTTLQLIGEKMEPEIHARLVSLDTLLKATNLIQRARLYALSGHNSANALVDCIEGFDEKISDNYYRVLEITRSIGQEVASKEDNFKELLPDILSTDGDYYRLYNFGLGLSDGCTQPLKMWQDFYVQLSSMEQSKRHYQVLQGFINATSLKNATLSETILDSAVTDSILASIYPVLQTSVKINIQGVERLKQSLEYGVAPIWQYRSLEYGRVHESISDKDLSDLLRIIASKPDGLVVATEILSMRLHKNPDETLSISDVIISLGQDLLLKMRFSLKDEHPSDIDYGLGKIIEACFDGDTAKDSAKALCVNMSKAFANNKIYHMNYRDVLEALATKQPLAFLDGFLDNGSEDDDWIEEVFSEEEIGNRTNPISKIDDNLVIDWCEANPKVRYPVMAQAISSYRNREGAEVLEWTPLSLKIIINSLDPITILNILKTKFRPMSWSGSRAEIMQKRLSLISDLKNHKNPLVSEWACKEEIKFKEEISSARRWEGEHEGRQNERFE